MFCPPRDNCCPLTQQVGRRVLGTNHPWLATHLARSTLAMASPFWSGLSPVPAPMLGTFLFTLGTAGEGVAVSYR